MITIKYIYALKNPNNNKVFYIGQTKDVMKRLMYHIRASVKNKYEHEKIVWGICTSGKMPIIEILEEVELKGENKYKESEYVCQRERFWIEKYSHQVLNLANNQNGGLVVKRRKCNYCGKEYIYQKQSSKYCSGTCKVYWNRENTPTQIQNLTKPTNQVKDLTEHPPKTNYVINNAGKKTFPEILKMAKNGESWDVVDAEIRKTNLSPNQVQMIFSKIKQ